MKARKIVDGVQWMGVIDWDRRLFDALIPLPDGTSYNAYLVQGSEKTALLDTVDPETWPLLERQLENVPRLDYVVIQHAEQDHSGSLPMVLKRYPEAVVLTHKKCQAILETHLEFPHERIRAVEDGESVDLGGKTLQFHYVPWVHWPDTMATFLPEDGILFSCDFFGSHWADSELFAGEKHEVMDAAKRYFAEIMMPFKPQIRKHLETVKELNPKMIAPSHGPVFDRAAFIRDAWDEWVNASPKNSVLLLYVSMHGSTEAMARILVEELADRGVRVRQIELTQADLGKIAAELVDAGTILIGTPTVVSGPHPFALNAAALANLLKPKAMFAGIFGSMGWGGKVVQKLAAALPDFKGELLEPVLCKGLPDAEAAGKLAELAETIATKHREAGLGE